MTCLVPPPPPPPFSHLTAEYAKAAVTLNWTSEWMEIIFVKYLLNCLHMYERLTLHLSNTLRKNNIIHHFEKKSNRGEMPCLDE